MSLDITLKGKSNKKDHSGIFIRENGRTKEISLEEWKKRNKDREPAIAQVSSDHAWQGNITHNLAEMASKSPFLYEALWKPEGIGVSKAKEVEPFLVKGLQDLKNDPEKFKHHNPKNGWGSYEVLVEFVEEYLNACIENPEAEIEISR